MVYSPISYVAQIHTYEWGTHVCLFATDDLWCPTVGIWIHAIVGNCWDVNQYHTGDWLVTAYCINGPVASETMVWSEKDIQIYW
jgi:hypothetical protein